MIKQNIIPIRHNPQNPNDIHNINQLLIFNAIAGKIIKQINNNTEIKLIETIYFCDYPHNN